MCKVIKLCGDFSALKNKDICDKLQKSRMFFLLSKICFLVRCAGHHETIINVKEQLKEQMAEVSLSTHLTRRSENIFLKTQLLSDFKSVNLALFSSVASLFFEISCRRLCLYRNG